MLNDLKTHEYLFIHLNTLITTPLNQLDGFLRHLYIPTTLNAAYYKSELYYFFPISVKTF